MYLILGVDPGTTTGVAAVTLDGRVHRIQSSRNMGVDQAVKYITSLGRPSLIASDVTPTPSFVMKIASSLGCSVFTLDEPLSISDKNILTSGYVVEDSHSRDALAAALNAFKKYKNKLHKISVLGYGDEVKHRVLQGTSLERVLSEMQPEKPVKVKKKKEAGKILPAKTPKAIAENTKALERQNKSLREQIKLKEFEISELTKEIHAVKTKFKEDVFRNSKFRQQEQIIESLEYKIKMLEEKLKEIEKMEDLWRQLASGKIIPVGVYPEIFSNLTLINYRISPTDLERLRDAQLVFTEDSKNKEILSKQGINTADAKSIHKQHNLAYIPKEDLQKILHPPVKSIENIVNEYRMERNKKK